MYSSVVQTEQEIRIYYICGGPANTTATFLCMAQSQDGISFSKGSLGLYEYNGSSNNNIVFATPYGPGGHKGTGW
eukprot:m.353487 g.353487  ORF g.353487 m.353487 type:complete len:75 (-) comp65450_c0_seq1:49-273(-)